MVPEPILVCGGCRQCLQGNYHMCEHVSYGYRKGQAGFGDYYICEERWAQKALRERQGEALRSLCCHTREQLDRLQALDAEIAALSAAS